MVVICSAQFNAVGIAVSLREIGWHGRVICLNINGKPTAVAKRWPSLCECHDLDLRAPEELPSWLEKHFLCGRVSAIYFCDERFLPVFADHHFADLFPKARIYAGSPAKLDMLLDRWQFYDFVSRNHLASVPKTVREVSDPWREFGGAFRTRVWRSWRGVKKLPRGRTISTSADLQAWEKYCIQEHTSRSEWGYQELLSTTPQNTVSVCGWQDELSQLYLVTRWLRQAGENGWLVEKCPDPHDLAGTTKRILAAIQYSGPFEMEFLKDARTDDYKVIELNPRFWMQHRIVGKELIRRYMGLTPCWYAPQTPPRYWLNTDIGLARLLTGRGFGLLRYLALGTWAVPISGSMGPAIRALLSAAKRKIDF